MRIIFKYLLLFFVFLSFFLAKTNDVSAKDPVYVTIFYSETCPHCAKEKVFLDKLHQKYSFLNIREVEVTDNRELFQKVSEKLGQPARGVPYTVIGEEVITGYQSDDTTGKQIENIVIKHSTYKCTDFVAGVMEEEGIITQGEKIIGEACPEDESNQKGLMVKLPILGMVDSSSLSLPVLTFLIAFMDGFNPCAMWVLLFLITLLINLKDRKKLLVLGSAFIIVSGTVYFLFLAAWLNVFFFLGFIPWLRSLIGVVAVISGYLHLRDYHLKRSGCKATDEKKRKRIFDRIQTILHTRSFWLALAGISALAITVNMLELVCSAGLPAIYTQILALSQLPTWQYYLYLLFYIVIFMLDDMIIFLIAVKTWHTIGISSKFSRYSSLIGGIVILILGLLLLFKPEWVMFG